jgi:integrase
MKVVKTRADKFAPPLNTYKEDNFLVIRKGVPVEFVFNKYKTSKTYGTQTVPIPKELADALTIYLKRVPKNSTSLLIAYDGTPLTQANAITRILNKTFGKKIGSSMLRHIYLSSKYDIDEMTTDATQMGHSLEEQKQYMKTPLPSLPLADTPPQASPPASSVV